MASSCTYSRCGRLLDCSSDSRDHAVIDRTDGAAGRRDIKEVGMMEFPERLVVLRKDRGLTQRDLASEIGVHVSQLRRYEAGASQPTLDVLRRMAGVLGVSGEQLLFDTDERGPGDDMRSQYEAVTRLDADEKQVVRSVLDAFVLRHDTKRRLAADSAEGRER